MCRPDFWCPHVGKGGTEILNSLSWELATVRYITKGQKLSILYFSNRVVNGIQVGVVSFQVLFFSFAIVKEVMLTRQQFCLANTSPPIMD